MIWLSILLLLLVVILAWSLWSGGLRYTGGVTTSVNDSGFYAVTVTDPDAPSRENPTNAPYLHWMVVNMRSKPTWEDILGRSLDGDIVMAWMPPSPPRGSGPHRYYTRIWKQPKSEDSMYISGRARFPLDVFAKKRQWMMLDERVETVTG
jgi:phosphatidylethanolamine-binding protein (PEBP) family uncharacterized protein